MRQHATECTRHLQDTSNFENAQAMVSNALFALCTSHASVATKYDAAITSTSIVIAFSIALRSCWLFHTFRSLVGHFICDYWKSRRSAVFVGWKGGLSHRKRAGKRLAMVFLRDYMEMLNNLCWKFSSKYDTYWFKNICPHLQSMTLLARYTTLCW